MIKVRDDLTASTRDFDAVPMDWTRIGRAVRRRALQAVATHLAARGLEEEASKCEAVSRQSSVVSSRRAGTSPRDPLTTDNW